MHLYAYKQVWNSNTTFKIMARVAKNTHREAPVFRAGFSATEPTESTALLSQHDETLIYRESLSNEISILLRAAAPVSSIVPR